MDMAGLNIDIGNPFEGLGKLAKDLRTAITGREPIDATKAAELALKAEELEAKIETSRVSVMLAEASSMDKWTSRARPGFLYVFYFIIISLVIIAPFVGIWFPLQMAHFYVNVAEGFKAIPEALWAVFATGYLGYTAARQYGKVRGSDK
jgi:hypothetical protein